jgi:hypothetical protein
MKRPWLQIPGYCPVWWYVGAAVVLVPWASLRRNGNEAERISRLEEKIPWKAWQVASKVKADLAIFSLRLERENWNVNRDA